MATGSPSEVAALVVRLASTRPPTAGHTRLVCIDGPAGSGKTTLGTALGELTGAQVIHGDDLMEGWRGLHSVAGQVTAVAEALRAGRPAAYRHFNWFLDRYDRTVPVPAADWLVVEGVGTGVPEATVLVWIEVDDELRFERGRVRDGEAMMEHWRQFAVDERALFAASGAFERADLLVDGTGASPPIRLRP